MSSNGKVLLAALAGAAIGVVAGMLVAPASGKETLEELTKKGEDVKKDLEQLTKKSKKSLQDLGEKLSENMQKNMNGVKDLSIEKED